MERTFGLVDGNALVQVAASRRQDMHRGEDTSLGNGWVSCLYPIRSLPKRATAREFAQPSSVDAPSGTYAIGYGSHHHLLLGRRERSFAQERPVQPWKRACRQEPRDDGDASGDGSLRYGGNRRRAAVRARALGIRRDDMRARAA